MPFKTAQFDWGNSGWIVGNSPMMISPAIDEYQYFPWDYDIFFTTIDSAYIGRTNPSRIYDDTHTRINRSDLITEGAYSFYVVNKSFIDSSGAYEIMDLLVHDQNGNGRFDWVGDRILVGPVTATEKWAGTVFAIMFFDSTRLPEPDDVYHVTFQRPFWVTDSLMFTVVSYDSLDKRDLSNKMDSIKVVPNPYVCTNAMEPAVGAWGYKSQRRRLLFTHLPAHCTIKIFTVSGVLVNEIVVNNDADNGTIHWDMLTKGGLEIAAGMYIYHIKAKETGDEKVGKFAVIK